MMKKCTIVFKSFFTLGLVTFFLLTAFVLTSCKQSEVDDSTLMLYAKAHNFYLNHQLDETVNLLSSKNTKKKDQKFVPILVLRGKAEYFLGYLKEAKQTFKMALSLRPTQV